MPKRQIFLNVTALDKAQKERGIASDTELAAAIGVSVTQLWRTKLSADDPRHNSPGPAFIAGVISAFGGPFEKYFSIGNSVRIRTKRQAG